MKILLNSEEHAMNKKNPKVDTFLSNARQRQEEMKALREIMLDSPLTEELKWGKPCYTFQNSNILIIQGFKAYCAVLFFKGALLKDPKGILVKTGENTQAGRQIRFTDVRHIVKLKAVLKAYIREAIEVEKAGLKVHLKKPSDFIIPQEFQTQLNKTPALKSAFAALTPGRQRAYILYFSQAKQSSTRTSRVDKCLPRILEGKGLHDRD